MLATPAARSTSRIDYAKADLVALVARMDAARQQAMPAARAKIDPMHQDIALFGLGAAGIFEARRAQIETGAAIQTALRLIENNSREFVASVSAILSTTHREIADRSAYFNRTVSSFYLLIIGTSLLCVAAGAAIFFYVRRAVIFRLTRLQRYMQAQVEGQSATVSIAGEDEIAEMARAAQFFVTTIEERERSTRAILEGSPIGVMISGRDGRLVFSNARWRELARVADEPGRRSRCTRDLPDRCRPAACRSAVPRTRPAARLRDRSSGARRHAAVAALDHGAIRFQGSAGDALMVLRLHRTPAHG
jgi:PAS domain-containing protein